MNVRSLLAAGSLVASMAFPSLAGAQVQIRAGIQVGTPPPPTVVVVQPQPQVVVAAPVQPVYVVHPAAQPVYVVRRRRPRVIVVESPGGVHLERRGGGHGRWHHGRH